MSSEENKDDGPNRIMVFLRIRPPKKGEIDPAAGTHFLLDIQLDNKTCLLESKSYTYDYVFNGEVDQGDIYTRVAEPVIGNVFKGYWGTIMVYGQTGTGKSFTMCNFSPRNMGIIPRAMKAIFDTVENCPDRSFTIMFSFIQIYLDKLQDLFNPEAPELKIARDKHGVSFPGIVEHTVKDEEDFRSLYDDGNQYRVITATKMNPESSRGHAALFIQVKSVPKDDPGGEVRSGKLFLIDLAGYERFSKTGVQEGQMALEAKTINASLLSLGNVVQALSDRSEHIPWRNAKLTRMLEDAIGGRAKCSIILTAGPSSEHVHETLGTLYFGSRAMAVKTNAKLAVNVDYKKLAAKLQELLTAAEGRINSLEVEATRRQLEREEAEGAFHAECARIKQIQQDQLNQLVASGATKEQIEELIRSNEEENQLMEEQQYQQRQALEERHEEELKLSMERQQQSILNETSASTTTMSKDIAELQRQVSHERQEKESSD
ncbi:kinesin [Trypanosoma rangeli SC58]|uniref:Kinesin n=1 Tax=Trypanosoma rangeli SC58 TaxID=429131 RepID=A0A061IWB7_TRYRA|nr:kinesin [Trypanosoma rangeli SC58]